MSNPLRTPIITAVGFARASDVFRNGGVSAISHIAVGDGVGIDAYNADGTPSDNALAATALQNERVRVAINPDQSAKQAENIILQAYIQGVGADFTVTEIGIFLADGTLFAYSASSIHTLGVLSDLVGWNYGASLTLTSVPHSAIQLDFGDTGPGSLQQLIVDALLTNSVNVPRPVVVAPSHGSLAIAVSGLVLIGSQYSSPNGYAHDGAEFFILDTDGNQIYSSGDIGSVTSHIVPDGTLVPETSYSWRFRYAGTLGGNVEWSQISELSTFETGTVEAAQDTQLYTKIFTSSANWVAPAGARNIDVLTGKGGRGNPSNIYSYSRNTAVSISPLHIGGTVPAKSHADSLWALFTGLDDTAFAKIAYGTKLYNTRNDGTQQNTGNTTRLYLRKTANLQKTGSLWTAADIPDGELTPDAWFHAGFSGLEAETQAQAGGTTKAFDESFVGGANGNAVQRIVNDIEITPGATYAVNVAEGGSVTIEYEALAGQ